MRTRTLLPALVLAGGGLAAPPAAAQAPAADSVTHKHELGLTASPQLDRFFTANRALPLGLLYKRQLAPGRFLRLRLVGHYSRRDTASSIFEYRFRRSAWQLQAFAGHEWQRPVGRRVRLYYGAEAGAGYRREVGELRGLNPIDYTPALRYRVTLTTQERQAQLRPFAGVQVRVGQRLTLFAESAAPLIYRRSTVEQYQETIRVDGSDPVQGKTLELRHSAFHTQLRLIHMVGASWRW